MGRAKHRGGIIYLRAGVSRRWVVEVIDLHAARGVLYTSEACAGSACTRFRIVPLNSSPSQGGIVPTAHRRGSLTPYHKVPRIPSRGADYKPSLWGVSELWGILPYAREP